ncbi:MAG: hypothetical protein Q8O89_02150 [Nanoarchaeota archaeon]|nr:hypothetical protein [Nanoarchaeota archaeon]
MFKATIVKRIAKNIRFVLIFILLASLLSIAACNDSKNTEAQVHFKQTHIGTKGLTMNFVKGLPPTEVYEGTDFQLGLEVRNEGAWDINGAKIRLGGFNPTTVSVQMDSDSADDTSETEGLLRRYSIFEGKSTVSNGAYKLIIAKARNPKPPKIGDEYDLSFIATACYGYKTEAAMDICIDPNKENIGVQQKKICTVKPQYKLSGGQGAPIAITQVEEEILSLGASRKVRLKIFIKNMGKGDVYKADSFHKPCSALQGDLTTERDLGIVEIEAKLSDIEIDCNPTTKEIDNFYMKLGKDADNYALCQYDIPKDSFDAYNSVLSITATYGYVETVSTKTTIKKVYGLTDAGEEAKLTSSDSSTSSASGTQSSSSSSTASSGSFNGCCILKSNSCEQIGKIYDGACDPAYYYQTPFAMGDNKCCIKKQYTSCSSLGRCNDEVAGCGDSSFYPNPSMDIKSC